MKFIYVSKQVETCIEALKKTGKAGTTLSNSELPSPSEVPRSNGTEREINDGEYQKSSAYKDGNRLRLSFQATSGGPGQGTLRDCVSHR
jgi:hypothetical protein